MIFLIRRGGVSRPDNYAMEFDDNTADQVRFASPGFFADEKKIIIQTWMKLSSTGNDQRPFGFFGSSSATRLYFLVKNTREVYLEADTGSAANARTASGAFSWGQAVRLTGVYDSTQAVAADRIKIYVNGSDATSTQTTPTLNDGVLAPNYASVGSFDGASAPPYNDPCDGTIFQPCMFSGSTLPAVSDLANGSNPLRTEELAAISGCQLLFDTTSKTYGQDYVHSGSWAEQGDVPLIIDTAYKV